MWFGILGVVVKRLDDWGLNLRTTDKGAGLEITRLSWLGDFGLVTHLQLNPPHRVRREISKTRVCFLRRLYALDQPV